MPHSLNFFLSKISSYLYKHVVFFKKTLVLYKDLLSTIMKVIQLLHKYPFLHFFVGWLWLSLLNIYMCQVQKRRQIYQFRNNQYDQVGSLGFAKFTSNQYIYTHSNTQWVFCVHLIPTPHQYGHQIFFLLLLLLLLFDFFLCANIRW